MATPGLTLINVDSATTMYIIWTTNTDLTGDPTNLTFNFLIDPDASDPIPLVYDGNTVPNNTNSLTIATGQNTLAYVWRNVNPVNSPDVVSDGASVFDSNGNLVRFDQNNRVVMQDSSVAIGGNNLYYTYLTQQLSVANNSSSFLFALPQSTDADMVELNSVTFPGAGQEGMISIQAGSSGQLKVVDPFRPNTAIFLWPGPQPQIGDVADYVGTIRTYDFMLLSQLSSVVPMLAVRTNGSSWIVTNATQPGCIIDAQCPSGQICLNGVCVRRGSVGTLCAANSDCVRGLICGLNGICQSPINICQTAADCSSGQLCIDNICLNSGSIGTPCSANTDCLGPLICGNNICRLPLPQCLVDANCPSDQVCLDRNCVQEGSVGTSCNDTADCVNGLTCLNNSCQVPSVGCQTDDDCIPGQVCLNTICVADGSVGTPCMATADCLNGLVCEDGTCQMPTVGCQTDTDCPANQICLNNICVRQGSPGTNCMVNSDCNLGLICTNNVCRVPSLRCLSPAECLPGQTCLNNRCVATGSVGTSCSTVNDCQPSLACFNDMCQTPPASCSSNDQCAINQVCVSSSCATSGSEGTPCSNTSGCNSGLTCVDGTCQTTPADGGGFPWWGWLIIAIVVVIIVGIIIYLATRGKSGEEAENQGTLTETTTT